MKWVNTERFKSFFPDPVGISIFNVKVFLAPCFVEKVIAVQALIKLLRLLQRRAKELVFSFSYDKESSNAIYK